MESETPGAEPSNPYFQSPLGESDARRSCKPLVQGNNKEAKEGGISCDASEIQEFQNQSWEFHFTITIF